MLTIRADNCLRSKNDHLWFVASDIDLQSESNDLMNLCLHSKQAIGMRALRLR